MYTMKLLTRKYLLVLLLTLPQLVFAQEVIQLKDPSEKINITVSLTDDITYSVYHEADLIIEPSPISMKLMDQNILGKDPKLIPKKLLSNDQIIYPQIYFKESIRDHYNELRLDFKGNYSLIFRAYEDGFAYRFVTNFIKPFIVEDEEVIFNFPKNPEVFAATPVHGLEELKWAAPETDQVTYDVVMPFIRMVAGPIDYTQGAMTNMNKENFKPIYSEPMSQGTRCRQLAEFVVFYSPLSMLCDAPTNYLKEPKCTRFIVQVPTVWDESKALIADIGKCIVMARQKDGEWYVGGLTNWEDREVEVDLSFLGSSEYKAEIFKDGINADRVGKDYKYIERTVRGSDKLTINMVGGGGFAVRIYK